MRSDCWRRLPLGARSRIEKRRYRQITHSMHTGASPQSRDWKYAQGQNCNGPHDTKFSFMTYNILADGLANMHWSQLYRGISRDVMEWPQRFLRLVKDIKACKPDILCLQEVDKLEDFRRQLEPLGYKGDYLQRTGGRDDGCATFWQTEKFEAVRLEKLEFLDHDLKDNVALITSLRPLITSAKPFVDPSRVSSTSEASSVGGASSCSAAPPVPLLVVANTHILFNPSRGDVKVAQLRTLLEAVANAAADDSSGGGSVCLITGDFNSQPGSAVHRFCRNGSLALMQEDRRHMSTIRTSPTGIGPRPWPSAEVEVAMGRKSHGAHDLHVTHPLQLTSAYEAVTGSEADFSTYQASSDGSGKTVDYIWAASQAGGLWQLVTLAVLASPSQMVLRRGLPSLEIPSDHVPLMAQFCLRPTPTIAAVGGVE